MKKEEEVCSHSSVSPLPTLVSTLTNRLLTTFLLSALLVAVHTTYIRRSSTSHSISI